MPIFIVEESLLHLQSQTCFLIMFDKYSKANHNLKGYFCNSVTIDISEE